MKASLLSAFFLVGLLCADSIALAVSDAEIRSGYVGCKSFLTQSPMKQREIAKRAGYSRHNAVQSCQALVRLGPERVIAGEHAYQNWRRHSSSMERTEGVEDFRCGSSLQCRVGTHCIRGTCQDVVFSCYSDLECEPGDACKEGVCTRDL